MTQTPQRLDTSTDDLDSLLNESVTLQSAVRAQRQGRRLNEAQSEALEANRLATEVEVWVSKECYAHIVRTSCQCGNHFEAFRGWYHYQEQRKGGATRLVCLDDHQGIPAAQYVTEQTVQWCAHCAAEGLEQATEADNALLATLGEAVEDPPTPENYAEAGTTWTFEAEQFVNKEAPVAGSCEGCAFEAREALCQACPEGCQDQDLIWVPVEMVKTPIVFLTEKEMDALKESVNDKY